MVYRFSKHWRRFRSRHRSPHRVAYERFKHRQRERDIDHMQLPQIVNYVCKSTDFFDCGEERVVSLLQRRPEVGDLDRDIDKLRAHFLKTNDALDGLTALLAQAPRAVLAQLQMEKFPHGYRNKQERLYELIDFNDSLVSTILLLDNHHRDEFSERVKQAADRICLRVGAPVFSNEQWTSIIRGLTREVAVYLAAKEHGFDAWLTDRAHDALGIDVQVRDPETGRYINIDVKTPSSFRHRMEQLVREGRLTERELIEGDERSYIIEYNGHGSHKVPIIVLCILPDKFDDLANWRFVDPGAMVETLNKLIRDHGLYDQKYGQYL